MISADIIPKLIQRKSHPVAELAPEGSFSWASALPAARRTRVLRRTPRSNKCGLARLTWLSLCAAKRVFRASCGQFLRRPTALETRLRRERPRAPPQFVALRHPRLPARAHALP